MRDGRPRALITGIDGQDGSYLAELLVGRGYDVWGTVRADPDAPRPNLAAVRDRLTVLTCDLRDRAALPAVIDHCRPRELYNFAASTFVPGSWDDPVTTVEVNATAVTAMLEAIRRERLDTRVYQASSSEVFGIPGETPQNEATPLRPVNPYGIAKAHAQLSAGAYREHQGLHVSVEGRAGPEALTDSAGEFSLKGLTPGRLTLKVQNAAGATTLVPIEVPSDSYDIVDD